MKLTITIGTLMMIIALKAKAIKAIIARTAFLPRSRNTRLRTYIFSHHPLYCIINKDKFAHNSLSLFNKYECFCVRERCSLIYS